MNYRHVHCIMISDRQIRVRTAQLTFFATVIAYMVTLLLTGDSDDSFTKFQQATGYFCTLYDVVDMALFVAIAALGGSENERWLAGAVLAAGATAVVVVAG